MPLSAYLDRIGLTLESVTPLTDDALRRVVDAHAASVPFENTRIHRGEPISLAIDEILDRLVRRREGGVCYELNGGLGWLLSALGAELDIVAAQVLGDSTNPKAGGLPMSHMALLVGLPGEARRSLVDVGFGGEALLRPAPADGDIVTTERGSAYRVDLRPRELPDFAGLAWWHSSSPESRFVRSVVVSSTRADGITTLSASGSDELQYRFRGVGETAARDVPLHEAQRIAEEVFGLVAPLPSRLVVYRPTIGAVRRRTADAPAHGARAPSRVSTSG